MIEKINKAIEQKDYLVKILPAQNRHSVPLYLPKKWEGSRVIIINLTRVKELLEVTNIKK